MIRGSISTIFLLTTALSGGLILHIRSAAAEEIPKYGALSQPAGPNLTQAQSEPDADVTRRERHQESDAKNYASALEEVVVTGSYIKRTLGAALGAPVDIYSTSQLAVAPTGQASSFLKDIPQNVGFTQGGIAIGSTNSEGEFGGSTINLRGLGAGGTLVLLNGHRQAPFGLDPDSRVDANSLLPTIMIDRLEILKDGASALYGSDAVAGVVNFISRRNFDGFEVKIDGQVPTNTKYSFGGDYYNYTIGALAGASSANGRTHLTAAFEYYNQSPLLFYDIDNKAPLRSNVIFISGNGFPGAFLVPQTSGSTIRVADPSCQAVQNANITADRRFPTDTYFLSSSSCGSPLYAAAQAEPGEQRYNGRLEVSRELTDWLQIKGGFGYVHTDSQQPTLPSPPIPAVAGAYPTVPASNPGNPFGKAVQVIFRPYSTTNQNGINLNGREDVRRVELELTGDLGKIPTLEKYFKNWTYDLSYVYSENNTLFNYVDVYMPNLIASLNGHGGTCACEYFNPFGSSIFASPGSPQWNNPNLYSFIMASLTNQYSTTLSTLDGVLTGDLISLPAGPMGLALGVQHRAATLSQLFSPLDTLKLVGTYANGDENFSVGQQTWAGMIETNIPLLKSDFGTVEISAAERYEAQSGRKGALNPKLSLIFKNEYLSFGGSWGTSTQTPSLVQLGSEQGVTSTAIDPLHPNFGPQYFQIRYHGNPNLSDQKSTSYNFNIIIRPNDGIKLAIDYWNFKFSDLITLPSYQKLIISSPDSQNIGRGSDGSLQIINILYYNAGSITTDGIDFDASYVVPKSLLNSESYGTFSLSGQATWVRTYDEQAIKGGAVFHGVGSDNQVSIGQPMARWRENAHLLWEFDNSSVVLTWRNFSNMKNSLGFGTYKGQQIYDLRYAYHFDTGVTLSIGALNLFNSQPNIANYIGQPYLFQYDEFRGRMLEANIHVKF